MLGHLRQSARSASLLQRYSQDLHLAPQLARSFLSRASDPSDPIRSSVPVPFPILGFFRYVWRPQCALCTRWCLWPDPISKLGATYRRSKIS